MKRREFLGLAGSTVGLATAGCSGRDDARDATATETSTDTPTGAGRDRAREPATALHGADEPKPDQPVVVENHDGAAQTVQVEVRRASGPTVHDEEHEVPAGVHRTVYNLRRADPDGIETFSIEMTLDGTSQSVQVKTNACYGGVYGSISETGEFDLTYLIC